MSTEQKQGWLARLKAGLGKSSAAITDSIGGLFSGKRKLDDATIEDLEDALIMADFGAPTAAKVVSTLSASKYDKDIAPEEVREAVFQTCGIRLEWEVMRVGEPAPEADKE